MELELLAPARTADIGIAAIDCGADAVYIAGPAFGARQAAGNPVEDIRRLCTYAHRFGARVFVTVNTILYDNELEAARSLAEQLSDAGADALIVQDMALLELAPDAVLHASTQCSIRTPEKARLLSKLGFSRLVLERQLSLAEIREISAAVPECEIECFVHGALCVCYSGQCWLSENLSGRSANRGACIQACRSRYDLVDEKGKVLVKDKALLSLKDFKLEDRLEELADAGVTSFKIEGRLKNESYVRNVVRAYSLALDRLVAARPDDFRRASSGKVVKSFEPVLDKTFNRGYTSLFIDGKKGPAWASMDAAKSMGEEIGKVISVKQDPARNSSVVEVETPPDCVLANGDGFAFVNGRGEVIGFRGDVCETVRGVARIYCKYVEYIYKGVRLFRNLDAAFEKDISRNPGTREIGVRLDVRVLDDRVEARAVSEDGRRLERTYPLNGAETANNVARLQSLVQTQLSKTCGIYRFTLQGVGFEGRPLLSAAFLNGVRRDLAAGLDELAAAPRSASLNFDVRAALPTPSETDDGAPQTLDYKANISNKISRHIYEKLGFDVREEAYELTRPGGAELMRSRYCIRKELGCCLKEGGQKGKLCLLNNGRRLELDFDCNRCEMIVKSVDSGEK